MSHRTAQLRNLFLQVGSELLRRIKEPAIAAAADAGELITFTDCELSRDLSHATFYVSIMANKKRRTEILEALDRAKGFLRHEMRSELVLKSIPDLHFRLDDTQEKAAQMMVAIKAATKVSEVTEAKNAEYEREREIAEGEHAEDASTGEEE